MRVSTKEENMPIDPKGDRLVPNRDRSCRVKWITLSYVCVIFALAPMCQVAAQDSSLRVFFMGRSEYGSSGGIPTPFEEVCTLAETPCSGFRHWDFVQHDPANGLPIGMADKAQNRHVRNILQTQIFDAVFFSFFEYNTEFYSPAPKHTTNILNGAESLYRQITAANAQPFVYIGYATLDNPGDTTRIAEGAFLLKAQLDSLAVANATPPAVFVPVNHFVTAMLRDFGAKRWFGDPLHPSEFGQYAIARLLFTCVTGKDPASFGHPARITEEDGKKIDIAINSIRQVCR